MFNLINIYDGEKKVFTDRGFTRGLPSKINKNDFDGLISDFIGRFYNFLPKNQKYYVEKATDITSEIHKIKKFIPNSKFIHIIRDGRNATISEIKLRKKHGAPMGIEDLYTGALKWQMQIEEAQTNSSQFSSDILEVKYEDLFNNTKFHLREIFEHIGLHNESSEINRICNKYSYKTNTVSMPTSVVAKENGELFNAYLSEMNKMDQALFEFLAGKTLDKLGYPNQNLLDNKFIWFYIKFLRIPVYGLGKKTTLVYRKLKRLIFS